MLKNTVVALLLLSLAGCNAGPFETRESIGVREPILFDAPVSFGRILNNDKDMSWQTYNSPLVLTPTSLYLLGRSARPYGINISYSAIDEVSVRDVPLWITWPLGEPRMQPELLVVKTRRANCWNGCVFRFSTPEMGYQALEIIKGQSERVDPFGRNDGPRPFWLSFGHRDIAYGWKPEPVYLASRHPGIISGMEELLQRQSGTFSALFNESLVDRSRHLFNEAGLPSWELRLVDPEAMQGVSGFYEPRLERARRLLELDPLLNSALAVTLNTITVQEKIAADYTPSVQLTFSLHFYFDDLIPSKPGLETGREIEIRHTSEEWRADSGRILEQEIQEVAFSAAEQIFNLLSNRNPP